MAGGYGYDRSMRDEDFEEEDVWAVVKERKDGSPKSRKSKDSSGSSAPRRLSTNSRMIPRSNAYGEGGSRLLQQSAPLNIPDWSKIYRKESSASSSYTTHGGDEEDDDPRSTQVGCDDDDDDSDDEKVPPHEWLAKKLQRSQISSFSVCEGAGRTLKGRDLSKVRNAVLTKTGFLE